MAADFTGTRVALGVRYAGQRYCGWQAQPSGCGIQDHLEHAISRFLGEPIRIVCAGRTDTGVHAVGQVVHLDTGLERAPFSWVRGVNTYLPDDIAVEWATPVAPQFDARRSAVARRYRYVLRASAVRPSLEAGRAGWTHRPLDIDALRAAAAVLLGTHDFSAFRSSECQAASPVKTMQSIEVERQGRYLLFTFQANAFLHHMIRNLMGSMLAVGSGGRDADWLRGVLAGRDRTVAAPTFMPDGLYFLGPIYPAEFGLPRSDDTLGLVI